MLVMIYGQTKFIHLSEKQDSVHQSYEEKDSLKNVKYNFAESNFGIFYVYPLPAYTDE